MITCPLLRINTYPVQAPNPPQNHHHIYYNKTLQIPKSRIPTDTGAKIEERKIPVLGVVNVVMYVHMRPIMSSLKNRNKLTYLSTQLSTCLASSSLFVSISFCKALQHLSFVIESAGFLSPCMRIISEISLRS